VPNGPNPGNDVSSAVGVDPGATGRARVEWTEHRLAQVAVGAPPLRQPLSLRWFRTAERLFGAVIDAWNAEREELQCDRRRRVMLRHHIG